MACILYKKWRILVFLGCKLFLQYEVTLKGCFNPSGLLSICFQIFILKHNSSYIASSRHEELVCWHPSPRLALESSVCSKSLLIAKHSCRRCCLRCCCLRCCCLRCSCLRCCCLHLGLCIKMLSPMWNTQEQGYLCDIIVRVARKICVVEFSKEIWIKSNPKWLIATLLLGDCGWLCDVNTQVHFRKTKKN